MSDTPDPQPVVVQNEEPLPVVVHADPDSPAQADARKVKESARTSAAALRTEDQRRISGIWERTQQIIALAVVLSALLVACVKSIVNSANGQNSTEAGVAFVFLASVANLVIGFYFGRTNHSKVGGEAEPSRDA